MTLQRFGYREGGLRQGGNLLNTLFGLFVCEAQFHSKN